jgi:hypothetical protein
MKYILSLITFTLTILYSDIYAQIPKSFPEDDAGFINTFTTYLSSNNRPESKESATWLKANFAKLQQKILHKSKLLPMRC